MAAKWFLMVCIAVVTACGGSSATPGDAQGDAPVEAAKELTSFGFSSSVNPGLTADVAATINGTSITATVPFGTTVTNLKAAFTSTGETVTVGGIVQVSDDTAVDYTNTVVFRVFAADNTTKDYTVTVAVAPSSAKELTAFEFQAAGNAALTADVAATITGTTITATVPFATAVTGLKATFSTTGMSVTVGGTAQTSGATANDFTSPVVYRVAAADGSTKDYTVTITIAASPAKELAAFSFLTVNNAGLGADVTATITGTTIAATVPFGTTVTALKATFTTTGASVTVGGTAQVSGTTANNFTSPVVYRVTAADGSTKDFTVTITVAASPAKDLTALSFLTVNNPGLIADVTATISGTTITATVPLGTTVTGLKATFTTTGASVTVGATPQVSGVTANDFTNPVSYRVTAADTSTQDFTVTVTPSAPVLASFGPAQSFLRVGQVGTPTLPAALTVTLSTVSAVDTDVAISSGDPTALTVVGNKVTVPAGQLTAPVLLTGLAQAANVTLTATLGGSLQANVRVLDAGEVPAIASLTPPTATIAPNGNLTLTVTLDLPPDADTVVSVALSPANAGTVPATVTVLANQLSATFSYVDAGTAGSAIITASLGASSASSTITISAPTCTLTHLVISEIRSRGDGGAGDEFVELYNPTASPVLLDNTWKLEGRSHTAAAYNSRWVGTTKTIPAFGHFLIASAGYTQTPAADQALSTGITDATALRLVQANVVQDVVCYAFSTATSQPFTDDATYACEGTPAGNLPHDNTTVGASTSDVSIERKPGGSAGNCTDTDDNATDFSSSTPANPQSSASPPTP